MQNLSAEAQLIGTLGPTTTSTTTLYRVNQCCGKPANPWYPGQPHYDQPGHAVWTLRQQTCSASATGLRLYHITDIQQGRQYSQTAENRNTPYLQWSPRHPILTLSLISHCMSFSPAGVSTRVQYLRRGSPKGHL